MIQLESSTLANQDISSALLVHTYTADDVRKIFIRLFADQVVGNDDYIGYITIQRLGAGSAYRVVPITTAAVASGVTAFSMTTIPFPVANSDVVKVYLTGAATDTTTPDIITEIWEDETTTLTSGSGGFSVNASGATVTTGNETNSYTDTTTAGVIHIVEDAGGTTDFYYEFDLGEFTGTATEFSWTGYVQSNNDTVDVQYYDWAGTAWRTLEALTGANGTTLSEQSFDVPVAATGTGANFGLVRMRFSSVTTTAIGTDRVRCVFNTLSTGIANGSTITLSTTQTNKSFAGENWNLALGGQDISGSFFHGANVTGISSASSVVTFEDCRFGAVTLPPGTYRNCGFGESDGRCTAASAGEYVFENCYSIVAGSGTPDFTFSGLAATTGINNRGWFGGGNYTLDSDCTLSVEVVGGGGQTFTTGGGNVEVRGRCRSVTLALSGAGTVQAIVATGPITISGTATTTVNLYGTASSLSDTSSGATVNNLTSFPQTGDSYPIVSHVTSGNAAILARGNIAWITATGFNTVVPDAAGTAKTLTAGERNEIADATLDRALQSNPSAKEYTLRFIICMLMNSNTVDNEDFLTVYDTADAEVAQLPITDDDDAAPVTGIS